VNFEEYLQSKKIDSSAFKAAEESVWENWRKEFEQLSPASFTAQKLYLINPVRRKYQLKLEDKPPISPTVQSDNQKVVEVAKPSANETTEGPKNPKPAVARPVFKPKPKIS
jgi:hypothetical protein